MVNAGAEGNYPRRGRGRRIEDKQNIVKKMRMMLENWSKKKMMRRKLKKKAKKIRSPQ